MKKLLISFALLISIYGCNDNNYAEVQNLYLIGFRAYEVSSGQVTVGSIEYQTMDGSPLNRTLLEQAVHKDFPKDSLTGVTIISIYHFNSPQEYQSYLANNQ